MMLGQDRLSAVLKGTLNMQVSSVISKNAAALSTTKTADNSVTSDFNTLLAGILSPDSANKVNEEELFAGLIQERIKTLKGDESESKFSEMFSSEKDNMRKADGFVPFEDAAKAALQKMRDSGELTAEEADKIYSESFSAAQLDSNTGALFDGRGGAGDVTIALQELEAALLSARTKMEKFDAGTESAEERSVNEGSNGKSAASGAVSGTFTGTLSGTSEVITPEGFTVDGANNFLFKPVSENEGTLAVLMPSELAYGVETLVLKDENGTVIEEGRSTGYGDTGEREKYAFSKPGGSYTPNLTVEARLVDGTTRQYLIPDPSQRYD